MDGTEMGYVHRLSSAIASRQAKCSSIGTESSVAVATQGSMYAAGQSALSAKHGAAQKTAAWSAHASSMDTASEPSEHPVTITTANASIARIPHIVEMSSLWCKECPFEQ